MKSKTLLSTIVTLLASAELVQAALLDFEEFQDLASIPTNQFLALGAQFYSCGVLQVGLHGIDGAHSGTKVMAPGGTNSIDGTSATNIAQLHGVPPQYYGASVGDIVFVEPGTTNLATVSEFSLWMGFDHLSLRAGEENRVIIEAFDLAGIRIIDYVSPSLTMPSIYQSFATSGVHRIRITQVDGVTIDDLAFGTPTGSGFRADIYCAVEVCWPSQTDRQYLVQWTPAIGPTNWTTLTGPLQGTGDTMCVFDSTRGRERRLYRVQEIE
jgi:hypothetical protein